MSGMSREGKNTADYWKANGNKYLKAESWNTKANRKKLHTEGGEESSKNAMSTIPECLSSGSYVRETVKKRKHSDFLKRTSQPGWSLIKAQPSRRYEFRNARSHDILAPSSRLRRNYLWC